MGKRGRAREEVEGEGSRGEGKRGKVEGGTTEVFVRRLRQRGRLGWRWLPGLC
jgi:hypothetical protein